jgi:hypothetical protein
MLKEDNTGFLPGSDARDIPIGSRVQAGNAAM